MSRRGCPENQLRPTSHILIHPVQLAAVVVLGTVSHFHKIALVMSGFLGRSSAKRQASFTPKTRSPPPSRQGPFIAGIGNKLSPSPPVSSSKVSELEHSLDQPYLPAAPSIIAPNSSIDQSNDTMIHVRTRNENSPVYDAVILQQPS